MGITPRDRLEDAAVRSVRIVAPTPEVAAWLRRALNGYDVGGTGLELHVAANDESFAAELLPILRTIDESLSRTRVSPMTVAVDGRAVNVRAHST
jgi:hypothetical protein